MIPLTLKLVYLTQKALSNLCLPVGLDRVELFRRNNPKQIPFKWMKPGGCGAGLAVFEEERKNIPTD